MTNEEAYNKLFDKHPVIIGVLFRQQRYHRNPEGLARAIASRDDSLELENLISQSAKHIYESGLTQRAADLGLCGCGGSSGMRRDGTCPTCNLPKFPSR